MDIGTRGRLAVALSAIALSALGAGCEGEKKSDTSADAGSPDAGPAQPVVGGRLGEALASAATQGAPPATSASGPPETGVFAPGAATAALPRSTPHKVEVISDGAEPRTKLASALDPKAEQKLAVTLGLRMGGQQGMPNLDLEVSFKIDKPKKDKAAADAQAAPAGSVVTGKVVSATLASMGLGGPPKEITDELAKLKGSTVRYQLSPANVAEGFQVELTKGADPGLDSVLRSLGEAISTLTPVLPDKPVGVGAYWMVTDRAIWSGAQIPMIRYRIFKIEKIEGSTISFSVDTRQYAEEGIAKIPGGPGGQELSLGLDHFDSTGKGAVTWSPASLAPADADLSQKVQARMIPPGAQGAQAGQRMVLQAELSARFRPPAAPPP
ncbi:MAG: hypothetical protein IT372_02770 [Polyangiaceae bacterium]|nr:hypothetical protein [Polyangiaceae bacterium]